MLCTMKDLLAVAKANRFAVPAFNICSFDMLKAIMEEVEADGAPVILEIHPSEIDYLGDSFVPAMCARASRAAVPVAIHLDHGASMADVMRAIRNGYTSVMIDASTRPYEHNKALTGRVVDLAHMVGVSVEAELGTIGDNNSAEGGSARIVYTDPDMAEDFVASTGIDALAVAIGTAHGLYPKDMTPTLNIPLLKELERRIDIPFVLHGGSGNSDAEVREATRHGICKVNLSSDLKSAVFRAVREHLSAHPERYEPGEVYRGPNDAVRAVVRHKLDVLGTRGKAGMY